MKKNVCHLSLEFPKGTNKKKTARDEAIYSADEGYVIKSYIFKKTRGLGPTSHNVSWVPGNSQFVSNSELSSSYNQAVDLAAEVGYKGSKLAELKADLNAAYSEFLQYSNMIAASHETISHKATIRGAGAFNGRTQYEAYLIVEVEEVPAPMRNAANLSIHFRQIIDDFKAKNPVESDTGAEEQQQLPLPKVFQLGQDRFLINKFEQLVRVYWDGKHKVEVISNEVPLEIGSLCYSEKFNTLFALTGDNKIFVVKNLNGSWETGIIPTWGGKIIPETLAPFETHFGVFAINEDGHFVGTWRDDNGGTAIPGGEKHSYAVIHETVDMV